MKARDQTLIPGQGSVVQNLEIHLILTALKLPAIDEGRHKKERGWISTPSQLFQTLAESRKC